MNELRIVSGTGSDFGDRGQLNEIAYLSALRGLAEERSLVIDVAPVYGQGIAEQLVGEHLASCSSVRIMTKLRIRGQEEISADASLKRSLMSLNRSEVDFLCTHWSGTSGDLTQDLEYLMQAKQTGLARQVGLGNPSMGDLTQVISLGLSDQVDFVQSECSLSDSSILANLQLTNHPDCTVFGYSPLSEGRIAPNKEARARIERLATTLGVSGSSLVLRWLMEDDRVRPITRSSHVARHLDHLRSERMALPATIADEMRQIVASISVLVELGKISMDPSQYTYPVFMSRADAVSNSLGTRPSPMELAEELREAKALLKPLKVSRDPHRSGCFVLVQGQLRFWAAMLAFGADAEVPAVLVDGVGN